MDSAGYAENFRSIVASGFVSLAVGLGHNLGLFSEFQKAETSMNAKELAEACKLKERYVEEWLGCMVASNIVFMDEDDKYYVPETYKEHLTIANFSVDVLYLGEMHRRTMQYFKKDGKLGFKYSDLLPDYGAWLDSRFNHDVVVKEILVHLEQFKNTTTIKSVLDIGCGEGMLLRTISKYLPNAQLYGLDENEKFIEKALSFAEKDGFNNLSYRVCNVECLPENWTKKFDWIIMYDVLHDLPHPKISIDEMKRVLKDDGVTTIVDPKVHSHHRANIGDTKVAGAGYAISCFVCLPCSSTGEMAAQNGIGWGEEKKQTFLEENGWMVKDKKVINNDPFAYAFTCSKKIPQ